LADSGPSNEELEKAGDLCKEKYANPQWNERR